MADENDFINSFLPTEDELNEMDGNGDDLNEVDQDQDPEEASQDEQPEDQPSSSEAQQDSPGEQQDEQDEASEQPEEEQEGEENELVDLFDDEDEPEQQEETSDTTDEDEDKDDKPEGGKDKKPASFEGVDLSEVESLVYGDQGREENTTDADVVNALIEEHKAVKPIISAIQGIMESDEGFKAVLNEMHEGKVSFAYAVKKHLDPSSFDLEPGTPEYEKHIIEKHEQQRQRQQYQENINRTQQTLAEFQQDSRVTPKSVERIIGIVGNIQKDVANGTIAKDTLELVRDAMLYRRNQKQASENSKKHKENDQKKTTNRKGDGLPKNGGTPGGYSKPNASDEPEQLDEFTSALNRLSN